jgi:hypothetical protein
MVSALRMEHLPEEDRESDQPFARAGIRILRRTIKFLRAQPAESGRCGGGRIGAFGVERRIGMMLINSVVSVVSLGPARSLRLVRSSVLIIVDAYTPNAPILPPPHLPEEDRESDQPFARAGIRILSPSSALDLRVRSV